jgi:ABC-type nitrate/sulfonate/bicarbonate transport system substrate-binding protein
VVNAAVAGEDLVMIAGLFNTYTYSLIVTPKIKTVQDIKGKALAISEPGSASDSAIRASLKSLNLKPEKDVAIVAIGGESERLAAMETGQVVGTVVTVPITAQAKKKGVHILVDMSKQNVPYLHTGISTTKRYIQANRKVTLSFMKAIVEAIALMKKDRDGAIAVMAKYLLLDPNQDAVSLNEAYDILIQNYLSKIPYPSLDGIQTLLKNLNQENLKAANFQPEYITDMSLLKELETTGFIRNLYN